MQVYMYLCTFQRHSEKPCPIFLCDKTFHLLIPKTLCASVLGNGKSNQEESLISVNAM
jgi:hypothetical protein